MRPIDQESRSPDVSAVLRIKPVQCEPPQKETSNAHDQKGGPEQQRQAVHLAFAEERAAMKETVEERRRARSGEVDGEGDVLAPQRDSEIFGRRFVYES